MIKKVCFAVVTLMTGITAFAQGSQDSLVTIIDGLKVPLVEKKYVANTSFQDNWHLGVYGGGNMSFGSDGSKVGVFDKFGPAFAVAVGKEITPISDLRMMIAYTRNTGVTDNSFSAVGKPEFNNNTFKFNTFSLNFDYMPNITNLAMGFREDRIFYLKGIIGVGGSVASGYQNQKYADALGVDNTHGQQLINQDKYDSRRHSLINLRAGLAGSILLSRKWNINIEAIANMLDNSFDSNPTTKNTWDGHLDVMVGVAYHFKGKGGKEAGFYYPRHDIDFYKKRLGLIDDLRDRTKKRIQEVEEEIPDTIAFDAHVTYTLIAFDEGSETIDRLQQTNIYTTAFAWAKEPKSDIYITNSAVVDDKLFRARAEAIKDALVQRYEVPVKKIKILADEKAIRPRGNYIVFIVND